HTTARKWETFPLHGTLAGHLDAYRHRDLNPSVSDPVQAAGLPPTTSVLAQPRRMPLPMRPRRAETGEVTAKGKPKTRAATWWDHTGPLALALTGGAGSQRGDVVRPARPPSAARRRPRLRRFLDN